VNLRPWVVDEDVGRGSGPPIGVLCTSAPPLRIDHGLLDPGLSLDPQAVGDNLGGL
jgi:hypothetical protein